MSTTYFDTSKGRWRVRWFQTDGQRQQRQFSTEAEARAFAASITDERAPRPSGPPTEPLTPEGIQQMVRRRTITDDRGCWIWTAAGGSHGYAQMCRRVDGKVTTFLVHRLSYEAFVGPIPEGLEIDHLCSVTKCVNPEHLEPVTTAENLRRRDARKQVSA